MQTLRELANLLAGTGALWWVKLPALGFWLCLGFAGREAAILISVQFGSNLIAATLAFVAAMVIWVVCIVLMLHAATRNRQSYLFDEDRDQVTPIDPAGRGRTRQEVLTQAVVPFLAVWSAWGFTEDHIQRVFDANLIHYGMDATNYSITFAAWPTYLAIAAIAWTLQAVIEILARGKGGVPLGVVRVFIRGTAILTAFLGLDSILRSSINWVTGRQFWAWITGAWDGFKELLPDWKLWWNQTVPEFVQYLADITWQFVVPGLWLAVLLPLVWLALTATVVGWEDLREVIVPGRVAGAVAAGAGKVRGARAVQTLENASAAGPFRLIQLWLRNQAEDIIPAFQALRLIMRSGWPFVAAYLALGAVVQSIGKLLTDVLLHLAGPQEFAPTMRYLSLIELAGELLMWTLAVALYATAFERAMRAVRHGTAATPATDEPTAALTTEDPPRTLPAEG